MNTQEFLDNINQTYVKGLALIARKNKDYANSTNPFRNFESASIVGIGIERAILLRVLDKISRASNLIDQNPSVVEESLEDTLLDAINYLAILKAYRENSRVKVNTDVKCCPYCSGDHEAWTCPNIPNMPKPPEANVSKTMFPSSHTKI